MFGKGRVDKDGVYYTPEQVASFKAGAKCGYKKGCHAGAKYVAKNHGVYVPKRNRLG